MSAQTERGHGPRPTPRWGGILLLAGYVAMVAVVIALYLYGSDYYQTDLLARARHPQYFELKPGGHLGHAYGIIGSAMMVVMLLYSLRKRWRPLRRWGRLSLWLRGHIFLGITGPLLVILHTSFKVGGLVAISFWSMIVVAASGIVGRYLYGMIPRRRDGVERTKREVERELERLSAEVARILAVDSAEVSASDTGKLRLLVRQRSLSRTQLRRTRALLRRRERLEGAVRRWETVRRAFHYWHVFHKPFALIMYALMIVHILVASLTGYGW